MTEAETLNAPVLVSVGRRMVSICAIYFNIPKLQFAGSSIEAAGAFNFNAPNLNFAGLNRRIARGGANSTSAA